MYRNHTCGEIRMENSGSEVLLAGWVQRVRNLGGMTFIDLRDRYGLTQLVVDDQSSDEVSQVASTLGREFVVQARGMVRERSSKNAKMATGDVEVHISELKVLNAAATPPFTIQDDTDGGDELRMKYRYLDLRRETVRKNLELRAKMAHVVRMYLAAQDFIETETPVLIKSTPEGARDFVVPSRMNPNQFYALPQSPQLFKQLLMVAGFDRYYQIVKCFRDEDLRADRQPEFTQIDCEMSYVHQEDVLNMFEGLTKNIFKELKGIDIVDFPRMTYADAFEKYGNDKPDLRFGMMIHELTDLVKGKEFKLFDDAEYVGGICATGCGEYTRKQLDGLTEFIKKPQIGGTGLVYAKVNSDGTVKSSVDKYYAAEDLQKWAERLDAQPGDLLLIMCGMKEKTLPVISSLRLEMGRQCGLLDKENVPGSVRGLRSKNANLQVCFFARWRDPDLYGLPPFPSCW